VWVNRICRYLILIEVLGLSFTAASVEAADWTNRIPETLWRALENPKHFELLSLDPDYHEQHRPRDEFHDFRILGSMTVSDAETRSNLVAALKKSAQESKGFIANCFNPRHGIRVIRDGKTNDLVICFECLNVKTFENDKQSEGFPISDSAQSAESLFNRVLMKQKIPLAGR
jgi:hypothetical protein